MEDNKTIFEAYITALGELKTGKTEENITALQKAATALSGILSEDTENSNIKSEIAIIEGINLNSEASIINNLNDKIAIDSLKFKIVANADDATPAAAGIDVKQLINTIEYAKVFNGKTVYKATAPTGEYIVFKGATGEFSELKGGKKSRKSKTHKQKKVHRSTQKRNGRKKTSHRRK